MRAARPLLVRYYQISQPNNFFYNKICIYSLYKKAKNKINKTLSLPLFPFVRGEVMPATFSLPHLLVFSTLLCIVSSSSSLPPLLPSSHLSLHSPPISALASLVSSCPALVTLPLSSVIGHRPSFLRVQPTVRHVRIMEGIATLLSIWLTSKIVVVLLWPLRSVVGNNC